MNAPHTSALLAIALFLAPLRAQDPDEGTKPEGLQAVLDAKPDQLQAALVTFIQKQVATNALYAGQYAGLRKVKDTVIPLLGEWVFEAPAKVVQGDPFRQACVRALRDIIEGEAPKKILETLEEIATDSFEPSSVREEAVYALAQFGDRKRVEEMIKNAEAMTKNESLQHQVSGHMKLAQIRYNTREYVKAVTSYKTFLTLYEEGKIPINNGLPTLYYNCACSMSLAGQATDALAYVEKAIEIGKKASEPLSLSLLKTDMDVHALRKDGKLQALIAKHYGGGAEKAPQPKKEAK